MKTLKKYNRFVESILPKPAQTELNIIDFYIPVKVRKSVDENMFSYYTEIDEIVNKLEQDGFEASWLPEQFRQWKDSLLNYASEEPLIEDYDEDDNDEFNRDYEEWEEQQEKYDSDDSDLINDYVTDEFRNWDSFLKEFEIDDLIDVLDVREQDGVFGELKDEFNRDNMEEYFDDFDVADIKVIGDNFNDGKFTVQVRTAENLTDENIETLKEWLEGQMSDGFGEGFEQQDIEGFSVSCWWNDEGNYRLGKYKIDHKIKK